MAKDDLRPARAAQAAKLLNRAYRRMKRKSWAKVAERYGISNKGRAYMIATGRMPPHPVKDAGLLRAILRESQAVRAPKKTLRQVRRVAVPFLEMRQRSKRRIYGAGGRPL